MAFFFGDGFDLYAAVADATSGNTYWTLGGTSAAFTGLVAGRFAGSRALQGGAPLTASTQLLRNSSVTTDGIHHFSFAVMLSGLSGSQMTFFVTLTDAGLGNQCTFCVRSDGALVLTAGNPTGTVIATYPSAVQSANTWYQFEVEIVIHNTAGSFTVRRNGNTSNDFSQGSLNTRNGSTNNQVNQIGLGAYGNSSGATFPYIDDFLWRSDAASVPWVGDIRCFTRMPASDASVAWSRSGTVVPYTPYTANSTFSWTSTGSFFTPFTAPCSGAIGSVLLNFSVASTANIKCSIYASSAGVPTTVLGSATVVSAPPIGNATFTFGTPVSVTQGTQYWVGWHADTASGSSSVLSTGSIGLLSTGTTYAAFPVSNPTGLSASSAATPVVSITPTTNSAFVADFQQDGATSYVYSSTVSQSDLYGIAAIGSTPSSIVGVTTRGYFEKSDAGTRNVAVQLQSGATNVQSASTALNTTWGWISRSDLVDPATGSAWTAVGVNNATIGPIVTA